MRYTDGRKISGEGGYIENLQGMWKKAKDTGLTIDSPRFIIILLTSFPKSWDTVTTPLYKEKVLTSIITDLECKWFFFKQTMHLNSSARFKSIGIIHIPGPPYSSSANGTVECGIGHKTGMVHVMMFDSGLPAK